MFTVDGTFLEAIWQWLLKMFLPSECVMLLLGIDPKETMETKKKIYGIGYKAKKEYQPQRPTTGEWLNKLPHVSLHNLRTLNIYICVQMQSQKKD